MRNIWCFLLMSSLVFVGTANTKTISVLKQYFSCNPTFDTKFQYEFAVGANHDVTITQCTMECLCNMRCLTYFYNGINRSCILHEMVFQFFDPVYQDNGWKFYEVVKQTGRCSQTDEFRYNRRLDLCYRAFGPIKGSNDGNIFLNLKQRCNTLNSSLVKVTNQERHNYIHSIIATSRYIAIQGTNTGDKSWTFDKGEPMEYLNWAENEPTSGWGNIVMDSERQHKWRTIDPNNVQNIMLICER